MLRSRVIVAILCAGLMASCTTFEDAPPTNRVSFVHFYSSSIPFVGRTAEVDTDGGFILSGEIRHSNGSTDALIIKTDARGRKEWERIIPGGVIKDIKATESHYIVTGDSIALNPESSQVHELVNSYARLMILDKKGTITASRITKKLVQQVESGNSAWVNVDYYGDAVTFDNNGNILMLGSYRVPGENMRAYLAVFDPSDITDSLEHISYAQLDHDYVNCNSIHVTPSSKAVWASRIYSANQNLSRQYTLFPFVPLHGPTPPLSFDAAPSFGGNDNRSHAVQDIQRSPLGFAAIGTYAETNGQNANIYFIRLDAGYTVIPGSVRYIDGQQLLLNNRLLANETKTSSDSQDEGLALAATDDGYVLAGSITSTPMIGNGGKDILLIKLDPFGNLIWKKILGGSGDEVVSSIKETSDKGLLIFGTNTINGLSSMMLIKTDALGNLDK